MFPVMCTIIVLQLYYNRVFLAESDEQVMIAQQAQAHHSPFIKLIVHNITHWDFMLHDAVRVSSL